MNIDMTQMITGIDGKPLADDATLRKVCIEALWNPLKGDENASAEQKTKCAMLAIRIGDKEVVDLSAEEVALIKDRVNRAYPHPGIVARAHALLDPPAPKAVEAA